MLWNDIDTVMQDTIFDLSCQSINGEIIPMERYRGHVLMIVNTASYCGFTPQFKGLEYLYRCYKQHRFTVLGFPCNQFGYQDPRDNDRISDFCVRNYGVTFPMFSKVQVNGPDAHPLFTRLKTQAPGFMGTELIKWNFTKFLVNREGEVVGRYGPTSFPRRLARIIEQVL